LMPAMPVCRKSIPVKISPKPARTAPSERVLLFSYIYNPLQQVFQSLEEGTEEQQRQTNGSISLFSRTE